jgi:hypothetical protein
MTWGLGAESVRWPPFSWFAPVESFSVDSDYNARFTIWAIVQRLAEIQGRIASAHELYSRSMSFGALMNWQSCLRISLASGWRHHGKTLESKNGWGITISGWGTSFVSVERTIQSGFRGFGTYLDVD